MRNYSRLLALLALHALSGCQYISYLKTNTTGYPSSLQSSPEVACSAMGATRGDASFDWCVAEEEANWASRHSYY